MDTDSTDRDDLAGDLGTVTDEEWRAAHERVFADVLAETGGPEEVEQVDAQFAYDWAPGRPGEVYIGPHERDEAPAPGQWIGRAPDGEQG